MNDFTLPDTLHETLSLAITDARKLDRRLYEPRYFYWHSPDNGLCLVCLAGCIVAGSLSIDRDREILPCSFGYETDRKLQAVNACRVGDWSYAFTPSTATTPRSNPRRGWNLSTLPTGSTSTAGRHSMPTFVRSNRSFPFSQRSSSKPSSPERFPRSAFKLLSPP